MYLCLSVPHQLLRIELNSRVLNETASELIFYFLCFMVHITYRPQKKQPQANLITRQNEKCKWEFTFYSSNKQESRWLWHPICVLSQNIISPYDILYGTHLTYNESIWGSVQRDAAETAHPKPHNKVKGSAPGINT